MRMVIPAMLCFSMGIMLIHLILVGTPPPLVWGLGWYGGHIVIKYIKGGYDRG